MNGCTYMFRVELVRELADEDDGALSDVVVDEACFNLHWSGIGTDFCVPSLVAGVFGTRDWIAKKWARAAGSATSPAKASASRANGVRGGRPRKQAG